MALPAAPILIRVAIAGLAYAGVGLALFVAGQKGRQEGAEQHQQRVQAEKTPNNIARRSKRVCG